MFMLVRWRAGLCLELGAYCVHVGLSVDGLCRYCKSEPKNVCHVFDCNYERVMRGILDLGDDLAVLFGQPLNCLTYW